MMIRFSFIALFLLIIIPLKSFTYSDEKKIRQSKPVYLSQINSTTQFQLINSHEKDYSLFEDSYVIRLTDDDTLLQGINIIGNYAFELEKGSLHDTITSKIKSDQPEIYFPKRELKVLRDYDKNIYFTDGSIEVVFKISVNLNAFAKSYDLTLERSFPSINAAIFSTSIDAIESSIKILKKDKFVRSANYDVINPNVLPD